MVDSLFDACASPKKWPTSWVMVFWMSNATQDWSSGPVGGHGGESTAVSTLEAFSSMSASKMRPVRMLKVVVVMAMLPAANWKQSYLLPHDPSLKQGSPLGAPPGPLHRCGRNRTRFWLLAGVCWSKPVMRLSVRGSSVRVTLPQVLNCACQVAKAASTAVSSVSPGVGESPVFPCEACTQLIWVSCQVWQPCDGS